MASFGWNRPEWWESVSSGSPRDRLDVTALAYSLHAADADAVVALMRDWNLSATDLPERALAEFPLTSDEIEPFLRSADALLDPETAAAKMTERLIALAGRVNEVVLALNILDVWRHRHQLMVRHTDQCSCLMTCSSMPTGIRALDAAIQTYYEDHHELRGSSREACTRVLRSLGRLVPRGIAAIDCALRANRRNCLT